MPRCRPHSTYDKCKHIDFEAHSWNSSFKMIMRADRAFTLCECSLKRAILRAGNRGLSRPHSEAGRRLIRCCPWCSIWIQDWCCHSGRSYEFHGAYPEARWLFRSCQRRILFFLWQLRLYLCGCSYEFHGPYPEARWLFWSCQRRILLFLWQLRLRLFQLRLIHGFFQQHVSQFFS